MFAKLPRTHPNTTDAFTDILSFAQYYHYVYYKFGTCFPIRCSPYDVQSIAKFMGRRSILSLGPVKCFSKNQTDYGPLEAVNSTGNSSIQLLKISTTRDLNNGIYIWKPHITESQRISLIALSIVAILIILFTFIDLILNQVPRYYKLLLNSSQCETHNKRKLLLLAAQQNGHIDLTVINQQITTNENSLEDDILIANTDCSAGHSSDNNKSSSKATNGLPTPTNNAYLGVASKPKKSRFTTTTTTTTTKNTLNSRKLSLFMSLVDDCSIIQNFRKFLSVESELSADPDREIFCIHGIRCITMSWIIITHTMQYNDWSAFARTRLVESHLESLVNQPLFNGSYLVDTFFLISGLLSSYTIFRIPASFNRSTNHHSAKQAENTSLNSNSNQFEPINGLSKPTKADYNSYLSKKFSTKAYLIGRYLRLTPQVLFTSGLFIVLPLLTSNGGPHWYTMTGEYSEYCSKNWWVNLLHIQAFYRPNEMCNFVSWWISVDMFYHLYGLALIWLTISMSAHRHTLKWSCALLVIANFVAQFKRHYELDLPPNLLSTIPQAGAMWTKMTINFFWSPVAHAFPFFWGFYVGFEMARRGPTLANWFNVRRATIGWLIVVSLLLTQSYSTYFWVLGKWNYGRFVSASFYSLSSINWSLGVSWIIVACKYGHGFWINELLSCKLFLVLSRTSYLVYLSHFIVLFLFFGSQNVLLEPTHSMMSYIIVGNICVSMLFGSILCVLFEMPWLNIHKRLMRLVR